MAWTARRQFGRDPGIDVVFWRRVMVAVSFVPAPAALALGMVRTRESGESFE